MLPLERPDHIQIAFGDRYLMANARFLLLVCSIGSRLGQREIRTNAQLPALDAMLSVSIKPRPVKQVLQTSPAKAILQGTVVIQVAVYRVLNSYVPAETRLPAGIQPAGTIR